MKSIRCRRILPLAASIAALLAAPSAHAATLYWDGGTVNIGTNGNGVSLGTAGDWDNTLGENTLNWDQGSGLAHVAWVNANLDTAFFGGTAGIVTLTDPITVGGLGFSSNSGYTITAGTEGLTFGAGTDHVRMINVSGTTSTATISGTVTGTGDLVFTSIAADVASTLTFNGTSAGGWSGTTTINRSMTVSLAASNQALLNTTGITLNGGNILLTNTATGSENTINRVSNTAAIASYGNGSISIANTATASRAYTETIGSITHNNGQLSIGFTTVQNAASNTQTLMVGGLTNSGTTSTIAINGGGSGAGSIHGNSNIRISGITTSTAANEIIGPWMTAGNILGAQSDWAVYVSDGVSGLVQSRAIAGSAQTTWTSSSATGNYTAANANPLTSTAANRLTADRSVNTLRATNVESAAATHTMTAATDTIAFAGHALTDGDVVVFRSAGGLTDARPYYVINSVAGTSFQLSLTPGGSLLDLTSDTEGFITTGLNLNGNTLGMNGFIVGTTATSAIGGGSASTITLPTTTSGNLYLHGATNYWIDPSIKDNGAGVLTLVKSGTNTVTLIGNNTYSGGTVLNAGTLSIGSVSHIGGASANLTFGGTATLAPTAALNFSGGTLTVSEGAFGTITGSGATAFATTTGTGTLRYTSGVSSASLNLGNASGFTGNLEFRLTGNAGYSDTSATVQFSSLGDGVGSVLQVGGGQSDSSAPVGQRANIVFNGTSALVFDNRQIELLPRIASNHTVGKTQLRNDSANAAHTWTINTDLSVQLTDARFFELAGSNTGNNAFNGVISNGNTGGTISFLKIGTGTWALGNAANSYTGSTNVTAGTLILSTLANGGSNSSIGASTNVAGNLILNGGTLRYTGAAVSTDRLFSLQTSSTIDASGTGAVNFTNTGAMGFNTGTAAKTLTLTGTNTGNNTIAAVIGNNTGATAISKTSIGTWVLSGANSMTGTNALSGGGTLVLDFTTNNNAKLATGVLTVTGGGNLILRGGSAFAQTVTSTTLAAGGGNLSITQDTSGTNTINLNAITRGSANNGATLSLDVDSVATTDTLNNTGGILGGWATVGSNWAKNSTNAADGAIVGLTAGEYTAMPTTGGTGTVNYQLTGAASLSGAVTGNTLRISNSADDQVLDLGSNRNLSVSGVGPTGGLLYAGGNNNNYTITGTGTSRLTPQNANQELVINTYTGTLTVEVPILSSASNTNGAFTKAGLGTLVLTAASDYTAATYVNQGVLRARNNAALGAVSSGAQSTFVSNGAALELANSVAIGAEALTITGAGVSSGGALRNVASNTSSYAGAITIGNGGARINSDTSGVLTLSGGVVTSQFNDVTFGGAGNTTVQTLAISGAGGLIKVDAGTATLSATNTYTGATTVNAGTLLVSGSISGSASTVNNTGSTLGGTGTVGAVTVNTGAILQGGDGVSASDDLSSGGNVSLNDGSIIRLTLGASNAHSSLTRTGGTWAFDNNQAFTFIGTEAGAFNNIIAGLAGTESGLIVGGNTGGWDFSDAFFSYAFTFDGANVDLAIIAVPEPNVAVTLLGGVAMLLGLRRRRRG